jgi:hypothetical protein
LRLRGMVGCVAVGAAAVPERGQDAHHPDEDDSHHKRELFSLTAAATAPRPPIPAVSSRACPTQHTTIAMAPTAKGRCRSGTAGGG